MKVRYLYPFIAALSLLALVEGKSRAVVRQSPVMYAYSTYARLLVKPWPLIKLVLMYGRTETLTDSHVNTDIG